MILETLTVNNFRCFYGIHRLVFSTEQGKSVTVIHGENGSGKTNILNAIYWCLTDAFTPRFQDPELLINKAAVDDFLSLDCWVELQFSHGGQTFLARRTAIRRAKSDLEVRCTSDPAMRVGPGQIFLDRIIPSTLARWFFFDAEAIGSLELGGSQQLKVEIRRVLGFQLVDDLLVDLDACVEERKRKQSQRSASKSVPKIQEDIDRIAHILPVHASKAEQLERELESAERSLQILEDKLRELPKSRPLLERIRQLEQLKATRTTRRQELIDDESRVLGEFAPAVLLSPFSASFSEKLRVKENSGRLPAPFSDQLVDDILGDGLCICGRPVDSHSDEEMRILSLKKSASSADFNGRVRLIQLLLLSVKNARGTFTERMERLSIDKQRNEQELAQFESEMDSQKSALQSIDEETVQALEAERRAQKKKELDTAQELGGIGLKIKELQADLVRLKASRERELGSHQLNQSLVEEIRKLERLRDYVKKTLERQERSALNVLLIELNAILEKYLTKHYKASVEARTYGISLRDTENRPVGRSTGEEQVLKFAFVSTIVALAAMKLQAKIDFMAEPTIAPLVLDAPFSALDPVYQSSVAANLAKQSSQLILLVSSASWDSPVANVLSPHVGSQYALISMESGPRGEKPQKPAIIKGAEIIMNYYDQERTETVLKQL